MKKKVETAYGVIGLGRFGEALAMMLAQSGHEVIAVDKDEKKGKRDAAVYRLCICGRQSQL